MSELRVLVGTGDLERSTSFYGDVLGLPVRERWSDEEGRGLLLGVAEGAIIELVERPVAPPPVTLAVEVDDVDAVFARVAAAGVALQEEPRDRPWGHRSFELTDPAGLPLVLYTPTSAA